MWEAFSVIFALLSVLFLGLSFYTASQESEEFDSHQVWLLSALFFLLFLASYLIDKWR